VLQAGELLVELDAKITYRAEVQRLKNRPLGCSDLIARGKRHCLKQLENSQSLLLLQI